MDVRQQYGIGQLPGQPRWPWKPLQQVSEISDRVNPLVELVKEEGLSTEVECNGICLDSADIGVPGYGVAYPHPDCPRHGR